MQPAWRLRYNTPECIAGLPGNVHGTLQMSALISEAENVGLGEFAILNALITSFVNLSYILWNISLKYRFRIPESNVVTSPKPIVDGRYTYRCTRRPPRTYSYDSCTSCNLEHGTVQRCITYIYQCLFYQVS